MQHTEKGTITLEVFVYSSSKKNGYYIYLKEKDGFDNIPPSIRPGLGDLVPALTFDLTAERRLAAEDTKTVLDNLEDRGFHLQITDPLSAAEKLKKLSER
ncbi:MAG: YcgL domain-containing protein [Pseudomonadota bacterium]